MWFVGNLTYTVGSRYSSSLKCGHLDIPAIGWARNASYYYVYCTKLTPSMATRYSVYRPAGCPKLCFQCNFVRLLRFGCGLADKIGLHLNRELIILHILETRTAKLVITFEVRSFFSRGYFLKCGHLAIPAKLHCPKGDRINESLLYNTDKLWPVFVCTTCSP